MCLVLEDNCCLQLDPEGKEVDQPQVCQRIPCVAVDVQRIHSFAQGMSD